MRIALSQINSKICDFENNSSKILAAINRAADEGSTVVVLPELALCGYMHRDSIERMDFLTQNARALQMIVDNAPPDVYAVIGTPMADSERPDLLYNACVVIHNNTIIHQYAKQALPHYDIFDELRYYAPSREWSSFEIEGRTCGIAICEDIWQAEHYSPAELLEKGFGMNGLALSKLDVLIVCSASPYEIGKRERRIAMMQRYCTTFNFDAVYVNAVGGEDGVLFDGQSFSVNRTGAITQILPMYEERHCVVDFVAPRRSLHLKKDPHADIYRSLVFGLREYLHKNDFQKMVLGLSGGIDSAVVAVVASDSIGAENVHALIMPSEYSAATSTEDALTLANTLCISHSTHTITELFREWKKVLQDIGSGTNSDITEQNIQARIRGALVMMYANSHGALPINTGNKSELAVGYCTQYGDMIGALAVIGDVYKSRLYRVAHYINRNEEIIPDSIIRKLPSAELKANQTDQDTLPPYEVLDRILMRYIEEKASVEEIVSEGVDEEVVRRMITLHHRSEYKRRQAPPVIRISKNAFGIGRRMSLSRALFELT